VARSAVKSQWYQLLRGFDEGQPAAIARRDTRKPACRRCAGFDFLGSAAEADIGAANVRVERIWGWDGGSFFLPHDKKVLVEIIEPDLPVYDDYTQLGALFSTTSPIQAQLHLEFQEAWEMGTAAVLASKVGAFPREASDYWDKFMALMAAQRTPIKVDLDFASRGSK
jgi:hypothetical protein